MTWRRKRRKGKRKGGGEGEGPWEGGGGIQTQMSRHEVGVVHNVVVLGMVRSNARVSADAAAD
jgi:hypothetical protein